MDTTTIRATATVTVRGLDSPAAAQQVAAILGTALSSALGGSVMGAQTR